MQYSRHVSGNRWQHQNVLGTQRARVRSRSAGQTQESGKAWKILQIRSIDTCDPRQSVAACPTFAHRNDVLIKPVVVFVGVENGSRRFGRRKVARFERRDRGAPRYLDGICKAEHPLAAAPRIASGIHKGTNYAKTEVAMSTAPQLA
jgi:hypothetical protein